MRRALLPQLPALTAFYGLRPWEIEHMTFAELEQYQRALDEHQRALKAASGGR